MKGLSFAFVVPILASLLNACGEAAPTPSEEQPPALSADLLAGQPAFVSVPWASGGGSYIAVRKDLLEGVNRPRLYPLPGLSKRPGVVDPPEFPTTRAVVDLPAFNALPGADRYVVLDL